eukprot:CAMPEP_0119502812 /NCGR_PEP_ID=MMETSP1344-20130328/24171_1 /TAXON_ID=236787 /ORGANISM="Florenciella parvula, Strain CCMP2471" /LENGTH=108 /DNA_ID=CAMNT_0007539051 /DNA_START=401 /DNA_END=727 /DNA_ORIENTATION=-
MTSSLSARHFATLDLDGIVRATFSSPAPGLPLVAWTVRRVHREKDPIVLHEFFGGRCHTPPSLPSRGHENVAYAATATTTIILDVERKVVMAPLPCVYAQHPGLRDIQ